MKDELKIINDYVDQNLQCECNGSYRCRRCIVTEIAKVNNFLMTVKHKKNPLIHNMLYVFKHLVESVEFDIKALNITNSIKNIEKDHFIKEAEK